MKYKEAYLEEKKRGEEKDRTIDELNKQVQIHKQTKKQFDIQINQLRQENARLMGVKSEQ